MASTLVLASESLKPLEQRLNVQLNEPHTPQASIAATLEEIRTVCTSSLLSDLEQARELRLEDRLWNCHQRINASFRTAFSKLPKTKYVERRKLNTEYLRFLKSAQKFYRRYIYDLHKAYAGIPELEKVAHKLEKDAVETRPAPAEPPARLRHLVLCSCHDALIQLGDLSRYRETEVPSKDSAPDWSHAKGYYELAGVVLPASGASENQLAVLALADNDLFRSVYHLYRSLVTQQPHPNAAGNLRKAFLKVDASRESGTLFEHGSRHTENSHLCNWYLQLLRTHYHGKDAEISVELERELLHHLESFVSRAVADATLLKITLTNIAAVSYARTRFQGEDHSAERMNSFLACLRLNIQTLGLFLRAFQTGLEQCSSLPSEASNLGAKLTPNLRCLLPSIRIYSAWLYENARIIAGSNAVGLDSMQQQFWSCMARTLSLAATVFPAANLPDLTHMLDEETGTIGFTPLQNEQAPYSWFGAAGATRERMDGPREAAEEDREMLFRVRNLLTVGIYLATQTPDVPLQFDTTQGHFFCPLEAENGPPRIVRPAPGLVRPPPGLVPAQDNLPTSSGESEYMIPPRKADEEVRADRMSRMVDDLVGESAGDAHSPSTVASAVPATREVKPIATTVVNGTTSSARNSGRYNIEDIVRGFRSSSIARQSPAVSPRSGPSAGASGIPSPALAPLSAVNRVSQSPLTGRDGAFDGGRPFGSTGSVSTPMARGFSGKGHGRGNSNESTPSRRSIWTPEPGQDTVNSPTFQSPGGLPLGNGTFGSAGDGFMPGNVLFGAANSPWTMSAEESHRLSIASPSVPSPTSAQWPVTRGRHLR